MKTRFNDIRTVALTAVLAAALAGCASSQTRESTGELVDDSVITTKVKSALLAEKDVNSTEISVETFKGRVLLSGFVKTPDQRQRAEGVARSVGGVRDISNQLELR
ncbi:MAG TPA: BON domain-containing protein [Burkholderiales bacterium]|nr:BON domain-containing protein [Burkholderiales bacterium]